MMKRTLLKFIEQHDMLKQHSTIIVAASGGPDSMALLHFLKGLQDEYQLKLIALTVDHQLRGEDSQADVGYVKSVCEQWGIQHEAVSVDVRTYAETAKISTQLAARTLRYEVFHKKMQAYDATCLAMGHHGDDQIETMLMSLMRVTTLHGVLGIPAKRPFDQGFIIRPFLCVTKTDIEQYCIDHHITPRIDHSNFDPTYRRNFIRQAIVPKLKEKYGQMHRTIQRFTESVQEDENYLLEQAKKMFDDTCTVDPLEKKITIDMERFIQYPVPLQRRCYRITLDYLYEEVPKNISYMHEELFMDLMHEHTPNKKIQFPQALWVEKAYNKLHMYRETNDHLKEVHEILNDIEQTVILPNNDSITLSYTKDKVEDGRFTYVGDRESVHFPLHIRTRKQGDKMTYKGLNGTKKLKDIFIDEKIPRHERDERLLVTDDHGEILWLIGLRKNEKEIDSQHKEQFTIIYHKEAHKIEEDNHAE